MTPLVISQKCLRERVLRIQAREDTVHTSKQAKNLFLKFRALTDRVTPFSS